MGRFSFFWHGPLCRSPWTSNCDQKMDWNGHGPLLWITWSTVLLIEYLIDNQPICFAMLTRLKSRPGSHCAVTWVSDRQWSNWLCHIVQAKTNDKQGSCSRPRPGPMCRSHWTVICDQGTSWNGHGPLQWIAWSIQMDQWLCTCMYLVYYVMGQVPDRQWTN
jgi:hypothetical protein